MKATAKIKGRHSDSGWVHGSVSVDDGSEFEFCAKVYDDPSQFGIETNRFPGGGNISKLGVSSADNGYEPQVLTYDRGWDYDYGENPYDSLIGSEKSETIIAAIAEELEKIVDGNTAWAKRYRDSI